MKPNKFSFLLYSFLFFFVACSTVNDVIVETPPPVVVNPPPTTKPVEKPKPEFDGADGPYVFYKDNGAIRILGADKNGYAIDTTFAVLPKDYALQVVSHDKAHKFDVYMQPFERNNWKQELPQKLLVISDPHGNLECFLSVLMANNVIDENYAWSFGENGLVIIGDIFDRGDDVLPIFWLTYKLQHEARDAGGAVHFLLGNHESMVLRNDIRYVTKKYNKVASHFEMDYAAFFGEDTELGRWIAKANTLQVIGSDLYVHGGLSENFYKADLTIPYINQQISSGLFLDKEGRNNLSEHSEFLFSSSSKLEGGAGPLWYRGMIGYKGEEPLLDEAILDALLERYQVKRIIVGHTIFPEVSFFYDGKVVAVNVNNLQNMERLGSRGILIENGETFIVDDEGARRVKN